jgi:hypothetical protein
MNTYTISPLSVPTTYNIQYRTCGAPGVLQYKTGTFTSFTADGFGGYDAIILSGDIHFDSIIPEGSFCYE